MLRQIRHRRDDVADRLALLVQPRDALADGAHLIADEIQALDRLLGGFATRFGGQRRALRAVSHGLGSIRCHLRGLPDFVHGGGGF